MSLQQNDQASTYMNSRRTMATYVAAIMIIGVIAAIAFTPSAGPAAGVALSALIIIPSLALYSMLHFANQQGMKRRVARAVAHTPKHRQQHFG